MKNLFLVMFACFLLAIAVGCNNGHSANTTYGKATDFELEDINGETIKLSDYSGKIIILNFFGTWCPPCRMEMPDFNEIATKYKNDVEVVALAVGGSGPAKVKAFAKEMGLGFTIAVDDGTVSLLYGPIRAIPVTVIIDKDFNIAEKFIGRRTKEVFENIVKKLGGES